MKEILLYRDISSYLIILNDQYDGWIISSYEVTATWN